MNETIEFLLQHSSFHSIELNQMQNYGKMSKKNNIKKSNDNPK